MFDQQPDKETGIILSFLNPMKWLRAIREIVNFINMFRNQNKDKSKDIDRKIDKKFEERFSKKVDGRDSRVSKSVEKQSKEVGLDKENRRRSLSSIVSPAIADSRERNAKLGRSMSVPNISLSK